MFFFYRNCLTRWIEILLTCTVWLDLSLSVAGGFIIFWGAPLIFYRIELKIFHPVNANTSWLLMLVAQYNETDCRFAFALVICRHFQSQK